ncbi:hypothetical protein [Methylotenera sp. G11]|nr:hypothetical protein [Methylotenera sp. G11]
MNPNENIKEPSFRRRPESRQGEVMVGMPDELTSVSSTLTR